LKFWGDLKRALSDHPAAVDFTRGSALDRRVDRRSCCNTEKGVAEQI